MATPKNRSERRSWDKYVAEAKETFSEFDLPNGETIRVYIPSADAVETMDESDDLWTTIYKVFGEDNAAKLREVAGKEPVTALKSLLDDVMSDLGISDNAGE